MDDVSSNKLNIELDKLNYKNYLTPKLIWNIEQNKPTLIVKDFERYGISSSIVYSILLGRGVFKWFSVRRNIIKLKNIWKNRITNILESIKIVKQNNNIYKLGYYRGYLKACVECREEIRKLCHSERWQAPDFDKKANMFLNNLETEIYSKGEK
jgi:hypothetical protein